MTPWDVMLRTACALGVPPEAFWRLSLAEWRALTAPFAPAALGRAELERLMHAWPD